MIRSIGFTGTQRGMTNAQKRTLHKSLLVLTELGAREFHHGDCVGADAEAARIARGAGLRVIGHPPANPVKRAFFASDEDRALLDYLARDRAIVHESDVLIGCPDGPERARSGTWYTIRYARRISKRHKIITPEGVIE